MLQNKYPKFRLIIFSIFIASIFLGFLNHFELASSFSQTGYLGMFLAGALYTYSFSGAFAFGMILFINSPEANLNPVIAALIGGIGAGISDLIIIRFIQENLTEEIQNFLHEKYIFTLRSKLHNRIKAFLSRIIGLVMIASPLPDEIGLTFLSNLKNINKYQLFVLCTILNSIGIFFVLQI